MEVSLRVRYLDFFRMYVVEILVKGCVVGLLVSAPMGPIGMLVVQRTLNRGRWHGFVSGLGAMLSDMVYATVTLAGMSAANDFLTANEKLLQLIGSVVLILFGYGVFRNNPLKGWTPHLQAEDTRYIKDFATAFLLTLSNFAIIFVFITLFARFQFNSVEFGTGLLGLSIVSVGLGALVWWFFITSFVSKIRKHFNRRGIIVLSRVVGAILMLIGAAGMVWAM